MNKKHNWTPEIDAMLGTKTDMAVAREAGINCHSVTYRRQSLGIPGFTQSKVDWTPDNIARLGTVPDAVLSRELGCSKNNIHKKRVELNIPSFRYRQQRAAHKSAPSWDDIAIAAQSDVFSLLSQTWQARFARALSYRVLADITGWSYSRIQKWFAPNTTQHMQMPIRNHLYLAVKYGPALHMTSTTDQHDSE